MVETSETSIGDVTRDPNFAFMIVGVLAWLLGGLAIIGPLFTAAGFTITVMAIASSAPGRNPDESWLGLLLGGLLIIVSGYWVWIPIIGVLANVIFVAGAFLVLFFGIPIALKYSRVPLHQVFQDAWAKRDKSSTKKPPKQDPVDEEDDSAESSNDL
jgi:hypothetical protein